MYCRKRILNNFLRAAALVAAPSLLHTSILHASTDVGDEWSLYGEEIPHVLTAVRLQQPTAEVPASVTVLDVEFILATGTTSISQLLRYVPGMIVAYDPLDNGDSVVYHGGTSMLPKSFQVQIDGRPIYRMGLAAVGWDKLPVAVEEIQRIEVVRGPNATTYGTNAYQAVVNIITVHPEDTTNHVVGVRGGDNDDQRVYAQAHAGTLNHQWRLSGVYQTTEHLRDIDDPLLGCSSPCADDRENGFIALRGNHVLNTSSYLDTAFVASRGKRDVPMFTYESNTVEDEHLEVGARYYNTLSSSHELKVAAYSVRYRRLQKSYVSNAYAGWFDPYLGELDLLNPQAAEEIATGLPPTSIDTSDPAQLAILQILTDRYASTPELFVLPISGDITADAVEYRTDIEIQDTYAPSNSFSVISGFGYRRDKVTSENFYQGTLEADMFRLFGNVNWRASPSWALHGGAMFEQEGNFESLLSVKAAANYMISPVESVRFVFSQAGRTPDFHEQHADWQYSLTDPQTDSPYASNVYYERFQGPGDLKHQTIRSVEIGYFGRHSLLNAGAEWDVRVFHEELTDIIYYYPSVRSEVTYTDNDVSYTGVEWQLALSPGDNTQLRLTGSLLNTMVNTQAGLEASELIALTAPSIHSLSWMQSWTSNLHSSVSGFVIQNGGNVDGEQTPKNMQSAEIHIYHDSQLGESLLRLSLTGQHDFNGNVMTTSGTPYEKRTRLQAGLRLSF